MPQLIWSPQALLDVQRLYRFLAPKNLEAAKRAVTAIRQGVNVLSAQPGMGRPVENMADEFRAGLSILATVVMSHATVLMVST